MSGRIGLRGVRSNTPYFDLEHDASRSLAALRRTSLAYPTLDDLTASLVALRPILDALAPRRVLVDMRRGPLPRNDVSFEQAGRDQREALTRGFERVAFVMATAVGALQANRLNRGDGNPAGVFREEAEAIAWLMADGEAPPAP